MNNVLLSWSGERSRKMAQALYEWLPTVIQAVNPWLSVEDIQKGTRWNDEVATQLQQQRVGIICLTSDNLNAPWLLYEAGALFKAGGRARICTYLLDIKPSDLTYPLAQFQATTVDKEETKKLLHTINGALGARGIQDKTIDKQFDLYWSELQKKLDEIPKLSQEKVPKRSQLEMTEEILELVRAQARDSLTRLIDSEMSAVEDNQSAIDVELHDLNSELSDTRSKKTELERILHERKDASPDVQAQIDRYRKREAELETRIRKDKARKKRVEVAMIRYRGAYRALLRQRTILRMRMHT